MNLLGELDLVMLLFSVKIIMHFNFVQVLVLKIHKRCNLTPNELKPLPLVLECLYLSTIKISGPEDLWKIIYEQYPFLILIRINSGRNGLFPS